MSDLMEVAVLGKDEAPLWIEKRRITEPRTTIEVTVDPEDNVTRISLDTGAQAAR